MALRVSQLHLLTSLLIVEGHTTSLKGVKKNRTVTTLSGRTPWRAALTLGRPSSSIAHINRPPRRLAAAVRPFALKGFNSNQDEDASHDQKCPTTSKAVVDLGAPLRFLSRELFLSYRFVHYDLRITVVPSFLLTLVTHLKASASGLICPPLWQCLSSSMVWMWLYIYTLDLPNQINGSLDGEDAVNKPTRPIPSGHVSREGARTRFVVVAILFLGIGYALKLGLMSTLWTISVLVQETSPLCKGPWHWLTKPITMGVGAFVMCTGSMSLVRAIDDPPALLYILAISVAAGLSSGIQDLRDMKGDKRKDSRITLPFLIGEIPARHLCNLFFICLWVIMHAALVVVAGGVPSSSYLLTSATILAWCIVLSYRTLTMCTPSQDHTTYITYTYLYYFLMLSTSWILY